MDWILPLKWVVASNCIEQLDLMKTMPIVLNRPQQAPDLSFQSNNEVLSILKKCKLGVYTQVNPWNEFAANTFISSKIMTLSSKDNIGHNNILIVSLHVLKTLNMKIEIQLVKKSTLSKMLQFLWKDPLFPAKGSSNAHFHHFGYLPWDELKTLFVFFFGF